ncbi:MAG TPA: BMP family ABC transporter substrate-binding protein, partial [Chloroflexia bacterium]|nr:BMP family ABC transporter substrate-binding protein [Chloroflexia bacterium]
MFKIFRTRGPLAATLLVAASMMLSACGADTSTAIPAVATAISDAATAVPAAATAASNTAATAVPAAATAVSSTGGKKLKVGLVTDVGSINDKNFNQASYEGVLRAQKELGADIKYLEPKDAKEYGNLIKQFTDDKYDVVVTVGFALGEASIAAAKASPDVKFIGVDQFQADTVPNLAGLVFDEDKAGYLAGALAAQVSKTHNIGAVLGTDAVPPVWRYGEGYKAGAKSIDPNITVQVVYHSDVDISKTFNDPAWGKTTALSMIDKGADIVFGAGGNTGNGALFAAAERKDKGVMGIGVDVDQFETVPESQPIILTSAQKLLTNGVFTLIKSAQDGSFKGGNNVGDVGLA